MQFHGKRLEVETKDGFESQRLRTKKASLVILSLCLSLGYVTIAAGFISRIFCGRVVMVIFQPLHNEMASKCDESVDGILLKRKIKYSRLSRNRDQ